MKDIFKLEAKLVENMVGVGNILYLESLDDEARTVAINGIAKDENSFNPMTAFNNDMHGFMSYWKRTDISSKKFLTMAMTRLAFHFNQLMRMSKLAASVDGFSPTAASSLRAKAAVTLRALEEEFNDLSTLLVYMTEYESAHGVSPSFLNGEDMATMVGYCSHMSRENPDFVPPLLSIADWAAARTWLAKYKGDTADERNGENQNPFSDLE